MVSNSFGWNTLIFPSLLVTFSLQWVSGTPSFTIILIFSSSLGLGDCVRYFIASSKEYVFIGSSSIIVSYHAGVPNEKKHRHHELSFVFRNTLHCKDIQFCNILPFAKNINCNTLPFSVNRCTYCPRHTQTEKIPTYCLMQFSSYAFSVFFPDIFIFTIEFRMAKNTDRRKIDFFKMLSLTAFCLDAAVYALLP